MNRLPQNANCLKHHSPWYLRRKWTQRKTILCSSVVFNHQKEIKDGFHFSKVQQEKRSYYVRDSYSLLNRRVPFACTSFNYSHGENISKFATSIGKYQSSRCSSNHTKDDLKADNSESNSPEQNKSKLSQKEQLKIAVTSYGYTVIVFHVCISLASLGVCYLLISNGVDAAFILEAIGFSESVISSKVAMGGSTFLIAYAVHKTFAPVRIAITLTATPFIVRYLRNVGFLKRPK